MSVEHKLVEKFGTKVGLYESRTPIPVLEEALRALPDDLLRVIEAVSQAEESLIFYGDNCLGLVLASKEKCRYEINLDALPSMSRFETPEGMYVGVRYRS